MSKSVRAPLPQLFEPKWVCAASLLFTPLYGSLLLARNWDELKEPSEARAARFWVRATVWLLILFVVMQTLFRNESVMAYAAPYFLIVLWGAWMLTSAVRQIRYMRTVRPAYERRPFGRTVTMGVFGWILYGMISTTISLVLVMAGVETLDETPKAPENGVIIRQLPGEAEPTVREMTPEEAAAAAAVTESAGIGTVKVRPDALNADSKGSDGSTDPKTAPLKE